MGGAPSVALSPLHVCHRGDACYVVVCPSRALIRAGEAEPAVARATPDEPRTGDVGSVGAPGGGLKAGYRRILFVHARLPSLIKPEESDMTYGGPGDAVQDV